MKVFADLHHAGLYASFHYLFEKRFGWELYRPIGLDWFEEGYWKIAEPYGNAKDTIEQFLGTPEILPQIQVNRDVSEDNGVYTSQDTFHGFTHKAITLKQFKEMKFDVVISSIPAHDTVYGDLVGRFQPKALHVAHVGNEEQTTNIAHVLSSVSNLSPQGDQKILQYHQEFDMNVYKYIKPEQSNFIRSFVMLLPMNQIFEQYKALLPDYNFEAYGATFAGSVSTNVEMAQKMSESKFGWHIKPFDGYGHVIHNWFAVGRPPIVMGSQYQMKMAGALMEDGVTCIDLDKRNVNDNVKFIQEMSEPENYQRLCESANKRFNEIVNFENEAKNIHNFLLSNIRN